MPETLTKATESQDTERAQGRGKRVQPVCDELKQAAQPEDSQEKQVLSEMTVAQQASLIRSPQVLGAQRARAVLNLQQTYGNRYVQRLGEESEGANFDEDVFHRIDNQHLSGKPLELEVRSEMEAAFDQDFSDVRVHTDTEANRLSQELGAEAFTTGKDVFFKEGAYDPGSEAGKGLLGHELAHVIQGIGKGTVALWGPSNHEYLTRESLESAQFGNEFSKRAKEILKDKSSSMDFRFMAIADALGMLTKLGRIGRELPNHGEGGAYQRDGTGINTARQEHYLSAAVTKANAGEIRDALLALGDALHVAQDRGAHGEGNPGCGHDPNARKPKSKGGRGKDWDPDNRDKNGHGWAIAEKHTEDILRRFLLGVSPEKRGGLRKFREGFFRRLWEGIKGLGRFFR